MSLAVLVGLLTLSPTQAAPPLVQPAGFLAEPRSKRGPGVLVLHPWWGLNTDVRAFCRRLAGAGFLAFAPDLFEGKTATTRAEAEALVKAYEKEGSAVGKRVAEGARFVAERSGRDGIAVFGFSFGGYYALDLSNAEPDRVRAVVDFYSTGPEDFTRSKAVYLGHFAERDEFEPKSGVDALRGFLTKAGRPATFYTYPGTGHWFVEPSVKGSYDRAAAELAWRRTVAFLRATIGSKSG